MEKMKVTTLERPDPAEQARVIDAIADQIIASQEYTLSAGEQERADMVMEGYSKDDIAQMLETYSRAKDSYKDFYAIELAKRWKRLNSQ